MIIANLVVEINAIAHAMLLAGYRITVSVEEDTYHFYGACQPFFGQPGVYIGYGRKRRTEIRYGTYEATISLRNATRLVAFLKRNGKVFKCLDEDEEPLTVAIVAPAKIKNTDTVVDANGDRYPFHFIDFERQGEKYGMLTILYRCGVQNGRRQFLAKCDCGGEKFVSLTGLRHGDNLSCGCRRGQNQEQPLLAGQTFNMLTVLKKTAKPATALTKTGHYYLCKCACGKGTTISRYDLTKGLRTSCGCVFQPDDLKGKVFGDLTVADEPSIKNGRNQEWKCFCACGNTCFVRAQNLRNSKTQSCGCKRFKKRVRVPENPL